MDSATYAIEADVEATHWWFTERRWLFGRLIAGFALARDARILDIGTSTGTNLRLLRELGFTRGEGLDASAEAVRWCAEKGYGKVTQGDVCALPFDDASFDLVLATDIIEHVDDDGAALREIRRVLKPGGRVLMIDIAGNDHPLLDTYLQAAEVLRDASHVRDYRADEWLAMFRGAGFDAQVQSRWRLPIDFETWVERIRTPADSVAGIRALWAHAPDEVRGYYAVQPDGSFEHDALLIDAR